MVPARVAGLGPDHPGPRATVSPPRGGTECCVGNSTIHGFDRHGLPRHGGLVVFVEGGTGSSKPPTKLRSGDPCVSDPPLLGKLTLATGTSPEGQRPVAGPSCSPVPTPS